MRQTPQQESSNYLQLSLAILAGSLISFLFVYIIGRYPFFWSDSEVYIKHAVTDTVTTYGTTAYPKFLQLSLGLISLWFSLIAQMLIASYVLWKFCKFIFPNFSILKFLILNLLLIPTSYHFFVDTIMPDIFLPLGVLCYYLILNQQISKKHFFIYLIFSFCVIAHNGFPYTFILFSGIALPIYVLATRSKSATIKSVFVFLLILVASFIVKPLLAMSYDVDVRKKRNLNFFCRQIILTQYDKLFKETLELGCLNYTSEVCDLNSQRKDILKLKYRNKWEPECKEIFLTALEDDTFRSNIIKSKFTNILKMNLNLSAYRNAGSNVKQHGDINKVIKSDPFLSITQSNVNQNPKKFSKRMRSIRVMVKYAFNLSLFGLFIISMLYLLQLFKIKMILIDKRIMIFVLFTILFIASALIFYGLFSRPGNTRYAMRFGWLIPFCFYLFVFSFINSIRKPTKLDPDS